MMQVEIRSEVNSVFTALHNKVLDKDVIPTTLKAKSENRVGTPAKFVASRNGLALEK